MPWRPVPFETPNLIAVKAGLLYACALSNQPYGYLWSDPTPVAAGGQYELGAWIRGESRPERSRRMDPEDSDAKWRVRVDFYGGRGAYLGREDVALGKPRKMTTDWRQMGGRFTPRSPSTLSAKRCCIWI